MREPVPNGDLFGGDTRTYAGNGYAADPGTGPAGETCGSCRHIGRIRLSKTYTKCNLGRANWTHGAGTDIRHKDPACSKWEPKP